MGIGNEAHFDSDVHAFVAGQVMGMVMSQGWDVTPVMDSEGNYTTDVVFVHPDDKTKSKFVLSIRSMRQATEEP